MSKDLVRLLKLQEIGTSAPRSSHGGIDESFSVIRQELDSLASKASVVSDNIEGLETKAVLQALELLSLRGAFNEREATRQKLEDQVSSLRTQLKHGLVRTEDRHSSGGQARGMPIGAPEPIVFNFGPSPEMGFPANLDIKNVPIEWKQEGTDWFAVFNPNVKRTLDITLVRTFDYTRLKCVRLSPDMKYLASACATTVHICDAETGEEISTFQTDKKVLMLCFSPDSRILAVGRNDEQIHIWDITTREVRYNLSGNTSGVHSLSFSSDGRVLMVGSYSSALRMWFLEDGTFQTIWANAGPILSVAISPNGLVALGRKIGSVELWETKKGKKGKGKTKLVETILGHQSAVKHLAFTRGTGDGLLSASDDKTVKYWDVKTLLAGKNTLKKHKEAEGGQSILQSMMEFTGHKESVTCLAVSHDNQWVVSGSKDGSVQFWDSETATLCCMLKCHTGYIKSVDLSQTSNILATGSRAGQVRMWAYM